MGKKLKKLKLLHEMCNNKKFCANECPLSLFREDCFSFDKKFEDINFEGIADALDYYTFWRSFMEEMSCLEYFKRNYKEEIENDNVDINNDDEIIDHYCVYLMGLRKNTENLRYCLKEGFKINYERCKQCWNERKQ